MSENKEAESFSLSEQLMAVEVITELLVSTSPQRLGEVLTEHLRELCGARTVMVLSHRPDKETDELLTVSPLRRATLFSADDLNLFCFRKTPEELPFSPEELPFSPEELPQNHPLQAPLTRAGIQSMVRYPLAVGGELIGTLLLFDQPGLDRISETNQIIHLLVPPIALALKNALNYHKIEQQAMELEQRVEERTAEFKDALAEAEAARRKIELILEAISDGLLFTDRDNRIVLMSPSAETILERCKMENLQRPMEEVLAGTLLLDQLSAISDGREEQGSVEWTFGGDDTGARICQARSEVVNDQHGEVSGIITLLRDVSRERELDRIKNEFISTAAHELRTPLTSVIGFSEILLKREEHGIVDPAQQKEFLSSIHEKSKRLEIIISDLLDLSRIQAGQRVSLQKAPCDICQLLEQITTEFQQETDNHQLELSLPEEPVELSADRIKLEQVLENLISNAIKFSPPGSTIRVAGRSAGDVFQVSVEDEGIGMTPKQVEKVFDKFYRVDASDTASEGLGLGMSIVKNIVEVHGGKIRVESELDNGTTVYFTLPHLRSRQ